MRKIRANINWVGLEMTTKERAMQNKLEREIRAWYKTKPAKQTKKESNR